MQEVLTYTPADRLRSARKFEAIIASKRRENLTLAQQIHSYLVENYRIDLPRYRSDFKQMVEELGQKYFFLDRETGEWLEHELTNLINLHYTLTDFHYSLGAVFLNNNESFESQTIFHSYTKNRVDPVWNYRKERLIRGIYTRYISENISLFKNLLPCHLVLTVPHAGGKFKGQTFYGHLLLQYFNQLRKRPFWALGVYGGEYGLETKQGADDTTGLHIHTHSFCLLYNKFNTAAINKIRLKADIIREIVALQDMGYSNVCWEEAILKTWSIAQLKAELRYLLKDKRVTLAWFQKRLKQEWEKLTGASVTWIERLYFHKKDDNSKWITEADYKNNPVKVLQATDDVIEYEQNPIADYRKAGRKRTKFYISGDSPVEDYVRGIMECIKYHFKGDVFLKCKGIYDVELIKQVLNNTKGKRLYSRFGAFHKVKSLNFNQATPDDNQLEIDFEAESPTYNDHVKRMMNDPGCNLSVQQIFEEAKRLVELPAPEAPQKLTFEQRLERLSNHPGNTLNLAQLIAKAKDKSVPDSEIPFIKELVNPKTKQVARPTEYQFALYRPEQRSYFNELMAKAANVNGGSTLQAFEANQSLDTNLKLLTFVSNKTDIKKLVKAMSKNRLSDYLAADAESQYLAHLNETNFILNNLISGRRFLNDADLKGAKAAEFLQVDGPGKAPVRQATDSGRPIPGLYQTKPDATPAFMQYRKQFMNWQEFDKQTTVGKMLHFINLKTAFIAAHYKTVCTYNAAKKYLHCDLLTQAV